MTWYCSTREERRKAPTMRNQQTRRRWRRKGRRGKIREPEMSLTARLASPIMSVATEILLKQQQRRTERRPARELNTTARLSQKKGLEVTASLILSRLVRKMSSCCPSPPPSLWYSLRA